MVTTLDVRARDGRLCADLGHPSRTGPPEAFDIGRLLVSWRRLLWAAACIGALVPAFEVRAESKLTIVAYNVESDGAEASTVAKEVEAIEDADIWGFSEVASRDWLEEFEAAAEKATGSDFGAILGTTGVYDDPDRSPDYLGLLYNSKRLERVGRHRELHSMNDWNHRSPLVARFRHVGGKAEFVIVLVHLASGDSELRMQQSWQLREWTFMRDVPVIMMGDFNYRWVIDESDDDPPQAYSALTAGGTLRWVRPKPLLNTWCGNSRSVFDFFFVNEPALRWRGVADVIQAACKKSDKKVSDHRPVRAVFALD